MARATGGNAGLIKATQQQAAQSSQSAQQQVLSIQNLMSNDSVRKRFEQMLGDRAGAYMSSVITVVNNSVKLMKCDPKTVLSAAATAAAMNLPIDPNLGFAHIVPYDDNRAGISKAQFQLGAKGYVQLAIRSGQYVRISSNEVREGEVRKYNRFTDEIEYGERSGNEVVGYLSYFKLTNGFEKFLYMTKEEMLAHAKRFSKAYGYDLSKGKASSPWSKDFDAMGRKTVTKLILSRWGILSIELQNALKLDDAVVYESENGTLEPEYIDNDGKTIDVDGITVETDHEQQPEPAPETTPEPPKEAPPEASAYNELSQEEAEELFGK